MNPQTQSIIKNHPGLYIICVLVLGLAMLITYARARKRIPSDTRLVRRPLMTVDEIQLFGELRDALPDFYVFPQVAMSSILRPLRIEHVDNIPLANLLGSRSVDFAICSRGFDIVCTVEICRNESITHQVDPVTLLAGHDSIPSLRIALAHVPSADDLRTSVLKLANINRAEIELATN